MASRTTRRILVVVGVILFLVLAAGGVAIYYVVSGLQRIGEDLSSDTTASFRPKVTAEGVEFEMGYGKNVTNLALFTVLDADGNKLWEIEGHGADKPQTVVYGQLPPGPEKHWTQGFPEGGSRPADIRGKHVKVEVSVRFNVAFGTGHQTYRDEFDIPGEPPAGK
jgi:hypothetical protein